MFNATFDLKRVNPPLDNKPPVTALLGDLADHTTQLIKKEWQLMTLEWRDRFFDYRVAAIKMAVGVGIIFLSLIAFSVAVINFLSYYWGITVAALVYGAFLLLIGILFCLSGKQADITTR